MADNKKKDKAPEPPLSDAAQAFIWKAQVAETADQWDSMCTYIKKAKVSNKDVLDTDGRNLFAVAYKNNFGKFRSQYRVLDSYKIRDDDEGKEAMQEAADEIKRKIVAQLENMATEVIEQLNELLNGLDNAKRDGKNWDPNDSARITYNKMLGDYNRYRAEYKTDKEAVNKNEVVKAAAEAYEKAKDLAEDNLPSVDPVRLGLMLNVSVFYYEVAGKKDDAIKLAKSAFDEAIAQLDSLDNDKYKDSTLIMQLLRDNMGLWTAENQEQEQN